MVGVGGIVCEIVVDDGVVCGLVIGGGVLICVTSVRVVWVV